MDLTRVIDIYCERVDATLLSEPVNLITNLSFLIAAYFALQRFLIVRERLRLHGPILVLITLIAVIGIGSALFHSFAMRWSMLADVIPIGIFLFYYLYVLLRYLFGLSYRHTSFCFLGFIALNAVFLGLIDREFSGGSNGYFGSGAALFVVAGYVRGKHEVVFRKFLAAAVVFCFALLFRSIDLHICTVFPIGTHFLWHVLNGLVLGILVFAAMDLAAQPQLHK